MLKSSNGKAFAHDIHHITQRSVVTRRNSADITAAASIRHDKREIKLLVILAERLENGIKRNTNFYQVREREKKIKSTIETREHFPSNRGFQNVFICGLQVFEVKKRTTLVANQMFPNSKSDCG